MIFLGRWFSMTSHWLWFLFNTNKESDLSLEIAQYRSTIKTHVFFLKILDVVFQRKRTTLPWKRTLSCLRQCRLTLLVLGTMYQIESPKCHSFYMIARTRALKIYEAKRLFSGGSLNFGPALWYKDSLWQPFNTFTINTVCSKFEVCINISKYVSWHALYKYSFFKKHNFHTAYISHDKYFTMHVFLYFQVSNNNEWLSFYATTSRPITHAR